MFGMTFEKLLLIGVIAGFLIGPERLPLVASALGDLARRAKRFANDTKGRIEEEFGTEEGKPLDWADLDPRRYDPRRIIREALADPEPVKKPAAKVRTPPAA